MATANRSKQLCAPVFLTPGEGTAAYSDNTRVGLAQAALRLQQHRKHGAELTACMESAVRAAKSYHVPRADFLDLCEAILGADVITTARRCWADAE